MLALLLKYDISTVAFFFSCTAGRREMAKQTSAQTWTLPRQQGPFVKLCKTSVDQPTTASGNSLK